MIKLKNIKLKNYCGFYDVDLDFCTQGSPNQITLFYGPNGIGKTTFLNAIQLLLSKTEFLHIDRIMTAASFSQEADKTYQAFLAQDERKLLIDGVFDDNGCERKVVMDKTGYLQRDIESKEACSLVDVDSPVKVANFQIDLSHDIDKILEMLEIVYGFPVKLDRFVEVQERGKIYKYAQDITINKNYKNSPSVNVHFKSMSAGEKKIAALFKHLLATRYKTSHIFCIDNISMHIYYKRHGAIIDKILNYFKDAQFFFTTHSKTMIDHVGETYGEHCLIDLDKIKG